jgi:hypothetical protein
VRSQPEPPSRSHRSAPSALIDAATPRPASGRRRNSVEDSARRFEGSFLALPLASLGSATPAALSPAGYDGPPEGWAKTKGGPALTRRDFLLIAAAIHDLPPDSDAATVAALFAFRLRTTNPRFDCRRFLVACGVDETEAAATAARIEAQKPVFA